MRRDRGAWLLGATLACAVASEAAALDARVRWLPSVDPRVVGYEVHVRSAGAPYGAAIDAGLPAPDVDGSMGWVVSGLTAGVAYRFTVTGYDAGAVRSGCPGELTLGTSDPCLVDQCCPGSACYLGQMPDGVPCGDACAICAASACSSPSAEVALGTTSFRLALRASGNRLRAKGTFPATGTIDPTATGLTLTVVDDPLLGVVVPRSAFLSNPAASAFRLRKGSSLGKLRISTANGVARVNALVRDSNLTLATTGWALRVGDLCASATDLDCTVGASGLSCR